MATPLNLLWSHTIHLLKFYFTSTGPTKTVTIVLAFLIIPMEKLIKLSQHIWNFLSFFDLQLYLF